MALRDYLRLVRIPAVFTVVSNILAAHLVATAWIPDWRVLAMTLLASAGLYHAGMVFNDLFDLERDRGQRPWRPLPSGAVALPAAWRLALLLLALGLGCAALAGLQSLLVALSVAVLVLLYDGPAKGHPVAPVLMAGCRWGNWLLGMSVAGVALNQAWMALPVFLYTLGLTLVARRENATQDRSSLWAGMLLVALAGLLLWLDRAATGAGSTLLAGILLLLLLALSGRAWAVRGSGNPAVFRSLVRLLIMGMIPLDALLLFAQSGRAEAAWLLLLMPPGWWASRYIPVT